MTKEKLPKLYCVMSLIKKWRDYEEIPFKWLNDEHKTIIPYEKGIKDYKKDFKPQYCEEALKELFTKQQVDLLITYLEEHHKEETIKTEFKEVKLPIANNTGPLGAIVDICKTYYPLFKEDGYDLPFKVISFCDREESKTWKKQEEFDKKEARKRVKFDPFDGIEITDKMLAKETKHNSRIYIALTKRKNFKDILLNALAKDGCLLCSDYKVLDDGLCLECGHNTLNKEAQKASRRVRKKYKIVRTVDVVENTENITDKTV